MPQRAPGGGALLRASLCVCELLYVPPRESRARFVRALGELEDHGLGIRCTTNLVVHEEEFALRAVVMRGVGMHALRRVANRLGRMEREERGALHLLVARPESDFAHLFVVRITEDHVTFGRADEAARVPRRRDVERSPEEVHRARLAAETRA